MSVTPPATAPAQAAPALPQAVQAHIVRIEALLADYEALPLVDMPLPRGALTLMSPKTMVAMAKSLGYPTEGLDKPIPTTYKRKPNDQTLIQRMRQAMRDIAPTSIYAEAITAAKEIDAVHAALLPLFHDLRAGVYNNAHGLARAEVFTSFLDQAQHLLDENHLIAAAVTAGAPFESHLKQLAANNGVDLVDPKSGKAIAADTVNANLVKAGAYDKTTQKYVTAWQGTRNDAAHPNTMQNVTKSRVADLIDGVRRFITDHPA